MMTPKFEFDPNKSRRNEERHGVSLDWARCLWDHSHFIISAKQVAGENRFLIVTAVRGKCFVAVFAMRGDKTRLISCHRADRRLEKFYERWIKEQEVH